MRKISALCLALCCSAIAIAQQVTGTVKDATGKGLEGATISLLGAKDSAVLKLAATKADGRYNLQVPAAGQYLIKISAVGYTPAFSATVNHPGSGDVTVPQFTLAKATAEMKGVTVTATKPMIEVKADKTIVNVENTINAVGNDALELLRKSPGVLVDKDDNISLSGKNGVQVYIDGKPSPLSGSDLSAYLKSMQSSQIEAIELITNPSAKYEAAGTAGIINIRLKKNKSFGANGSVNAGWNIGTYAKYNGGGAINYRNKKINLFGNFNHNRNKNENLFNLYRTTAVDTVFDQRSQMLNRGKNYGFKAGMDYYASARSTVGVMVNGNFSDYFFGNDSRTEISYIKASSPDRLLLANNSTDGDRKNLNANINYRFADTSGRELNLDADYGFYKSINRQIQPNDIYDAGSGNIKESETYNMYTPSDIDIYSVKADYEQPFKKGKLGLGGKVSYVQTDNTFQRFAMFAGNDFEDHNNNFKYRENINALYANYNRQFKGFMIQAGVRVENTWSQGRSKGFRWNYDEAKMMAIDSVLERNYTDPFPSAAVTFNKNPMNQWSITYSRRIDRPTYQNLNPFEFNLDKYTFQRGNTELRPQYTNSFGITNTYKYKLTTTLNFSSITDVFAQIPDNEGTKGFITTRNVAKQNIVSLNVSMPFQYKKYSVYANLNTYYSHYKGQAANYEVDINVFSFNSYVQQTLKVAKNTTVEVSGFYSAPSVWQGAFKSKAMGGVDAGVQQGLFKGKATLKATVTDIFRTMPWAGTNTVNGQIMRVNGQWESRQFRLNLSYRFGNTQVKAARQRKTSIEEESGRTGGGGGIGQ